MQDVENLWVRLEAWATDNAPHILSDLCSGATTDQVRTLETELDVSLPDSFKTSLAVHSGEDDGWPAKVFTDYGAYLSTSCIAEEWRQRQQFDEDIEGDPEELIDQNVIMVDGPVKPKMFLTSWVPFLECNGDVFWDLDFSPAAGGKKGQVIEVDWEGNSWKVIADSFADFLENYVTGLERGEYTDAINLSAYNPKAAMGNNPVRRFRLMFGTVVFILGLYLVTGDSGSISFYLGIFAMAWGGWIVGKQLWNRNIT